MHTWAMVYQKADAARETVVLFEDQGILGSIIDAGAMVRVTPTPERGASGAASRVIYHDETPLTRTVLEPASLSAGDRMLGANKTVDDNKRRHIFTRVLYC